MRVALWAACGLVTAALFLAAFLKPPVIPVLIKLLLYPLAIILYLGLQIFIYIDVGIQKFIDDTYRIPGTQVALRTTFDPWALQSAPYLEIRIGDEPPLRFCMAGPSLTRAQLYSVEGGRILLETSRDIFLIDSAPSSVKGPRSWALQGGVFLHEGDRCDYDAGRGAPESPERERVALKSGLKLVYIGAFDRDGRYRRFYPASVSPEQRIALPSDLEGVR
jgi:hypothetical protein